MGAVLASRHCVPKGGGSGPLAGQGHPPAVDPCPSTASSVQEETKAKEEEGVPDEEGWVKVTRRGRRPVLPRTEAASLRVLEKEKRKRARKELLNFYAWQHRETKMERKIHLRAPHTSRDREQGRLRVRVPVLHRDGICPMTEALGIWASPPDPQSAWAGICQPPADCRVLRDLRVGVLVGGCLIVPQGRTVSMLLLSVLPLGHFPCCFDVLLSMGWTQQLPSDSSLGWH